MGRWLQDYRSTAVRFDRRVFRGVLQVGQTVASIVRMTAKYKYVPTRCRVDLEATMDGGRRGYVLVFAKT